jgi:uncharacterized protein YraI
MENENLSPALAQIMATLAMPAAYAGVVAKACANLNKVCPLSVRYFANR